jgi:aminomethyltransferase
LWEVRSFVSESTLKKTPLYDAHVSAGARMVEFAGWSMPLLYRGIAEEHRHTRTACSVFDVSHMGRIEVHGAHGAALVERVCTRRVGDLEPGRSRYSHICNDAGGILDDVIVSRYETDWLIVCNASNRARIANWLRTNAGERDVTINDVTEATAMVAVQGPKAVSQLAGRVPIALEGLERYALRTGVFMEMSYTVWRSGYTGEDGFEVMLPAKAAAMGWEFLLQAADEFEPAVIRPAGLGARDTLRIEAGLPLYGQELHEHVTSLAAGFGWCVDLSKEFIGAEALRKIARVGPKRMLVGLELSGKRIARTHSRVRRGGAVIGEVTSGTFGPTVGKSIAMAYVERAHAEPGTAVSVVIREGHEADAVVVKLPFYRRKD